MAYKIYIDPESPVLFAPGAFGSGTAIEAASLVDGGGCYSSQYDLGAGPRSALYEWRAQVIVVAPPNPEASVDFYLATGNGTLTDGGLTGVAAALDNIAKVANMKFAGSAVVPAASGGSVTLVTSGLVSIHARYIRLVAVNRSGATLGATSSCLLFYLTAVPDEQQS